MFGSRTVLVSALLACACGGSSETKGVGGASPGVTLDQGGGGSDALGGGGANGLAGANSRAGAASAGAGSSGAGSSGAGSSGAGSSGAGAPNNGSTCPVVVPCGGDLVGDWKVKQECVQIGEDAIAGLCPGATIGVTDLTADGTVSFKADNTMTSSGNFSFTETIRFPTSCMTADQCRTYAIALSAEPSVMNPQCVYDALTGCSCTMTSSQATMNSGTYQVQGSTVTITSAAGAQPEVDSFCVSGNTLSIAQTTPSSTATLILTK